MAIAPTLQHLLDEQHAEFEIISHPPTRSAMQTAKVSQIPPGRMAKAVLLDTDEDYLLAVLPADHRIRISDLKSELGRRPRLVGENELGRVFDDCETGAVPPLASGYGISTIIDDSLHSQPDVYFEAGDHESLVHMNHDEFSRLTSRARHGHFSEPWSLIE